MNDIKIHNDIPNNDVIIEIRKFLEKNRIGSLSNINFFPSYTEYSYINCEKCKVDIGPIYYILTPVMSNRNNNKIDMFEHKMEYKYDVSVRIRSFELSIPNNIKLPNKKYEIF